MKNNLLFIDTETTGIKETDRIVQVAYRIGGQKVWSEGLFKPEVPISFDAMSITHITNEDVADKPIFKDSEMFKDLKTWFGDILTVLVAHNADYDMKMLAKEGLNVPQRHICTMKISHHHDKEAELEKNNLQYLRYYYNLKFEEKINPHDALSDIIVLEKLLTYYEQFYTIDEMVRISSKPILLKKFPFGKHKGEFLKEVIVSDRSYFEWMWNTIDMDENMRHTIGYYLRDHHRINNF